MDQDASSADKGMTGYYADCYVLVHRRDRQFVHAFLNQFIPVRSESASEYEVPQYSKEPTVLFKSSDDLLDYLAHHPNEQYGIYWRNEQPGEVRGAMCFSTNDGYIIMGLYCDTRHSDTSIESAALQQIMAFCSSDIGYITYEDLPPANSKEFIERSEQRTVI